MKKIESFQINHNVLQKGLYVSRIDGDAVTYDIRMVLPNGGIYLDNAGLHTFEHLFATYVRNSSHSDEIIYVGPMGCRTGFYLITRDTMTKDNCISLLRETFFYIALYKGEIPGAQKKECGNYLEHDLAKANAYGADMAEVLKNWTPEMMQYKK